MHSLAEVVRSLRRRGARDGQGPSARPGRLVPALASVLSLTGTAIGAVPVLGGNADGTGPTMAVLAAQDQPVAGASSGPPARPVTPLHGLKQADLLVVAPFSLSRRVLAAVARQPGITGAEPAEAARIQVNGAYTAVLGVDPSAFRGYAAAAMAASDPLWQGVAGGGIAVSRAMGTLDRLRLGSAVTVSGRRLERLPVVGFGAVGISGVEAVVSDPVARSLGMPAGNAIVVSAPPASLPALAGRIKALLPRRAAVQPLVKVVTRTAAGAVGITPATSPGVASAAGVASGYRNPLRDVGGLVPSRVDMGVDFGGVGPVYALGDAVITNATGNSSGWPGGGWITYQLTDGPDAGLMVHLAEDVTPTVQVGQRVSSSTVIADMFAVGDGIETGWAQPSGLSAESQLPEAGAISGGGPFPTVVGVSFDELLVSLGAPAAPNLLQPAYGLLPARYRPNGG
jgi:hypothetical protein